MPLRRVSLHSRRGRITCSPAAGFAGSVDKTGTAATQVTALFGAATPGSFSVTGETVSFTGADIISNTRSIVEHDPDFAKVYLAEMRLLLPLLTKANKKVWRSAVQQTKDADA